MFAHSRTGVYTGQEGKRGRRGKADLGPKLDSRDAGMVRVIPFLQQNTDFHRSRLGTFGANQYDE